MALSIKCDSLTSRTKSRQVKNEFSLVGLTACIHVKSTIFKFRAPPLLLSPALIGLFFFFFQVVFYKDVSILGLDMKSSGFH